MCYKVIVKLRIQIIAYNNNYAYYNLHIIRNISNNAYAQNFLKISPVLWVFVRDKVLVIHTHGCTDSQITTFGYQLQQKYD